jgi:hypothetical protein
MRHGRIENIIEAAHVIVGDGAFPLKTYLMRPYSRQDLDISKRVSMYQQSVEENIWTKEE